MRKILLFLLLIQSCLVFSANPEQVFDSADKAYIQGDYKTAVLKYEQILSENKVCNTELYFNLGNAYFKLTDYPNAILNYERALKLNPNDEDIRFNISMANSRIEDKIETVPELFYKRWFVSIREIASADSWGIVFIISLLICSACFFLYVLGNAIVLRKLGFYLGVLMLVASCMFLSLGISMYKQQTNHNQAIVFSGSVPVKSSPVDSGTSLFVIHAGTKVNLIDELGDWVKIQLVDGNEGWLPLSDLERI
jgi:tetratricopeptide (TPR) repeat protein